MRSLTVLFVVAATMLLVFGDDTVPLRPEEIKPKPFEFEPPQIRREKLDNGVRLFTLPDPDSPLLKLFLMFEGGAVTDPKQKSGLSAFGLEMLKAGGCAGLSPDELDERIDSLAAHFSFTPAQERLTVFLSVLPEDFEPAVELLFRMLKTPAFNEAALKWRKRVWVEDLKRAYGNAVNIARLLFKRALYADTPYANPESGLPEGVNKIERADLVEWHRRWIRPENSFVGLTGPFDKKTLRVLRKFLEDWKVEGERGTVEKRHVKRKAGMRMYLYRRSGLEQVSMIVGSLSAPRTHPERFLVDMLEYCVSVRVNIKVRNESGLAYSAYASYSPSRTSGIFYAEAQTEKASAVKALRLMVEQLRLAGNVLPTDDAMSCIKNYFLNSFIFRYSSKANMLEYNMMLKLYGFADDYLSNYCKNIEETSSEQIAHAGARFIESDALVVVLVGEVDGLEKQLKRFFPDAKIRLLSSFDIKEQRKER